MVQEEKNGGTLESILLLLFFLLFCLPGLPESLGYRFLAFWCVFACTAEPPTSTEQRVVFEVGKRSYLFTFGAFFRFF